MILDIKGLVGRCTSKESHTAELYEKVYMLTPEQVKNIANLAVVDVITDILKGLPDALPTSIVGAAITTIREDLEKRADAHFTAQVGRVMKNITILAKAQKHETMFSPKFMPWLVENVAMYKVFEELANDLYARGRRYYSSRTIGEKMRFDHDISDAGEEFKLNNNYTPDLGRLYVLLHPQRVNMFNFRRGGDFPEYVNDNFKNGTL